MYPEFSDSPPVLRESFIASVFMIEFLPIAKLGTWPEDQ
jgi:hypothetical protein